MHYLVVTDNPDFQSDEVVVKNFNQLDDITDWSCYRVEVPRFDEVEYSKVEETCRKLANKVRQNGYLSICGHTNRCVTASVLENAHLATILEKANFFYSPMYLRELFLSYGLELDFHKYNPSQPYIYEIRLWR